MRNIPCFALAALFAAPVAQPAAASHEAWRWERALAPNTASPAAEQCAVLDPALFAGAAPGLRDLRLLQNGRELAYAIDESVDSRSGANPKNDRSIYDTVATSAFNDAESQGVVSAGATAPMGRMATVFLPARVPVERLRLIAVGDAVAVDAHRPVSNSTTMRVRITARPETHSQAATEPEIVELQAGPDQLLLPVTLGANLQEPAGVTVHVDPAPASLTQVALEMRRREICYQPLSESPVTLLFGNAKALPVHYAFGRYFQPKATPLLSSMGPVHPNPGFHEALLPPPLLSKRVKTVFAIFACVLALVLTVGTWRPAKR